jgi:hypothetical protein
MKILLALAGLVACLLPLGACVSTQQNQPRMGFTRGDGRLISADEKLRKQFLMDWAICKADTDKVALTVPPVYWRGIGGMISASVVQQKQVAALVDIAKGCMAQRGYVYGPVPDGAIPISAAR